MRRQKRLNKAGCVEKETLTRLLWYRKLSFNCFSFSSLASVVCLTCQDKLKRVKKLEKDLMSNINELVDPQYCG